MVRILIVDDHALVRHGIRALIASNRNWDVCGEAQNDTAAHVLAKELRPDVIILDLSMPGLGAGLERAPGLEEAGLPGINLARLLHADLPEAMLLAFTMRDDAETVKAALAAGVRGYVLKSDGERQLAAALHALGARRSYYSPSVLDFIADAAANDDAVGFTPRELEVVQLIANGLSNRSIARRLSVTVKTVESHRASALRKANVHSGAELVRFAMRHQLIA